MLESSSLRMRGSNLQNNSCEARCTKLKDGCAGLFGSNVSAASVTVSNQTITNFSSMTLPSDMHPAIGNYQDMVTGTWSENADLNDPYAGGSLDNMRLAGIINTIPECATNATYSLSAQRVQVMSRLGDDDSLNGAFIVADGDGSMLSYNYFDGSTTSAPTSVWYSSPASLPNQPFTLSISNIPLSAANIASGQIAVSINFDNASDTGTQFAVDVEGVDFSITYDNSSCPVVATDPDISTTPSSTPVTINILGNDTGTGLSVSKIDNQTIAAGDTITLSNGSGTVKLNTDSTITFTPNSTFSGESIFSYSITDGASTVDTGVVRITVAAATTTNTTTTTPSTPTASTTSTNSTKVLAKTGEDVRLVAGGGMLVLAAAIYIANLRVKLGKY